MDLRTSLRRIVKASLALVLLAFASATVLIAIMWLDHTRKTQLPSTTGSFAVGRTFYDWTDTRQTDEMAPEPGIKREVLAWVWYPAAKKATDREADYLPAPSRIAIERQRGFLVNHILTRDLSRVRSNSIDEASISLKQSSFPVILMQAASSTSLAEDLASHGYIVVGLYAPYRTGMVVFPDGRAIPALPRNKLADHGPPQIELAEKLLHAGSADMSLALDKLNELNRADPSGRFIGRVDIQQVGAFGWSIGGATALQFCHDDKRCKAAADVDGFPLGSVVSEGVDQPILFLMEDLTHCDSDAECRQIESNIRSIISHSSGAPESWISIRGANHFMFSEDGAVLKSPLLVSLMQRMGIVHTGGRRQLAVTAHCLSNFFDVHLKGTTDDEIGNQPKYPEIISMR